MDGFEQRVLEYINRYDMFSGVSHCVCGVSGGADSVCLLTVLTELSGELGVQLHVVHVNHMIRGAEADRDEQYVKELSERIGVTCDVFHIDVPAIAAERGLTVEEAGRMARYESFRSVCEKYADGGCVTAVAHNMGDVAETVFFNMARGTGIGGMKGIPPVRDGIVRPLLNTSREDIEMYLRKRQIVFCMDSTNIGDDYSRNKVRHVILPVMAELNDRAVEHICAAAEVAAEYEHLAEDMVTRFLEGQGVCGRAGWEQDSRSVMISDEAGEQTAPPEWESGQEICHSTEYSVDMEALRGQDRLIQELAIKRLIGMACGGLKDVGRSHVGEVMKLLSSQTGAGIDLPYGARAYVSYGKLVFMRSGRGAAPESDGGASGGEAEASGADSLDSNADVCIDISAPGIYDVPGGRLEVRVFDKTENLDLSKKEYTKYLDYAKICTSVQVRTYRPGDYIVVDASGARKKINRLYTDCKIPSAERGDVLLVAAGSEVLWVIGVRMSEAYKITAETREVMELIYTGGKKDERADRRDDKQQRGGNANQRDGSRA